MLTSSRPKPEHPNPPGSDAFSAHLPSALPAASIGSTAITPAIPIVGLASCGVKGLEQIMPFAVTAGEILLGPGSLAVVASGESMVPAGIASGNVCYCDPNQQALPGEAVFFRRRDSLGSLKLFLGKGGTEGTTAFQGWLPPADGRQEEFTLDVYDQDIDCIAPVICVRRRL